MKDYLVIVESPHKAQTIQKYLGSNYRVVASMGHIRDLAVGNKDYPLGVDIENDFKPIYELDPGKKKLVAQLKKYVAESKEVLLATDPDREGEAISWHLAQELGLDVTTNKRLEFHEITYHAIQEAIKSPRTIDLNLVESQETRRISDRIIGFKVSQLIKKKINSPAAGRVQSVVLKLVVDRQKEIDAFEETEYYRITGNVIINKKEVPVSLIDNEGNEVHYDTIDQANEVIAYFNNNKIYVDNITSETKQRASKPIYTTSTMQQDASIHLHFNSKKTMKIAQELYEGIDLGNGSTGLITYMRTDSVRVTPSFINQTKDKIKELYGENYVGTAKVFNKNSENVQDAHEGIRPTDIKILPETVDEKASKDQAKLYRLVYNRAMSSMMKDEVYEHSEVTMKCGEYTLLAVGEKQIFDGFLKVLGSSDKTERIPFKTDIQKDSAVSGISLEMKSGKTKGPSAYNEASLIHTMEKDGIGRPSTYATTLDNIKYYDYVEVEKNNYKPTNQGKLTTEELDTYFAGIFNIDYTAKMETKLDEIAEGKCHKLDALKDFYQDFLKYYDVAIKEMPKKEVIQEDLGLCPQCGKPLVRRKSKYGSFIACSGYPACKFILNESKAGQECPKCHEGKLMLRTGRYGKFYACSNFPKCDYKESAKKY